MFPSTSSCSSRNGQSTPKFNGQQQQQLPAGRHAGSYNNNSGPPPPFRPNADININVNAGRREEIVPAVADAETHHHRIHRHINYTPPPPLPHTIAATVIRPMSAIPILSAHPRPALVIHPPPGHPGAAMRDYAAVAIAAARQHQHRQHQNDTSAAAAAAATTTNPPRDAQQQQYPLVYAAFNGSHQSIVMPPPQQQKHNVTTHDRAPPPSPAGGSDSAAISGSFSSNPTSTTTDQRPQLLPTRSALQQFLSTPDARNILAQAAAAAVAQLSKTPTASAAAAASANLSADLKLRHAKSQHAPSTTSKTMISKQQQQQHHHQQQQQQQQQQHHLFPTTNFAIAANNNATTPLITTLDTMQSHPLPQQMGNQHETSILINEKYGKENPHIYNCLVRMLGKAKADRIVKEAVDETLFDEEKNAIGNSKSPSVASSPVAHDAGGLVVGNSANETLLTGTSTEKPSSSEQEGGMMIVRHPNDGDSHQRHQTTTISTSTAMAASATKKAKAPSDHSQNYINPQIENVSIDDSAVSGEDENGQGQRSGSSSTCDTDEKNPTNTLSALQPKHDKPYDDDASLINAPLVEDKGVGLKRKFDKISDGGSGMQHHHPTKVPTSEATANQTSPKNNSVAATTAVAAPTSNVNTMMPSRPKQVFFLDRDGKISCAMVNESNLLRAQEHGGGLEMLTMAQGGATSTSFANTIAAVDTAAAVDGHSPTLSPSASASCPIPRVPTPGRVHHPLLRNIDPAAAATTAANPALPLDSLSHPGQQLQEDPPGFEQFRSDPILCSMILKSVYQLRHGNNALLDGTNNSSKELKGGMFVHGLLNIADDNLIVPPGGKPDLSVRQFAQNVLCPYFHIPPNLAASERHWDAYAHITSDIIYKIANDIVYERRKSMKSAVQLANYELGNLHEQVEVNSAKKDHRIYELEQELAYVKEQHAQILSDKAYQHFNQIRECEKGYAKFVKSHGKEMSELKKEMETMRQVHTTFLESYAEASLDALRHARNRPPSPSENCS